MTAGVKVAVTSVMTVAVAMSIVFVFTVLIATQKKINKNVELPFLAYRLFNMMMLGMDTT